MSFCPSETPVINALSYVKAIAKVHNGINRAIIECRKEGGTVEFCEVVMEDLRSLSDAEVCVGYDGNFMPGHTFVGTLCPHYNRIPLAC